MKRIACTIDFVELENDRGRSVEGVQATCSECDNVTESFGTSSSSIRRCLVLMREECPCGEENYYFAEDGEDEGA